MTFEENLKTKKELRFKNGKFKIVMFSDLHGKITFDRRTVLGVEELTEELKPDLVLLGGDNVCGGSHLQSEQLSEILLMILPIFLNHVKSLGLMYSEITTGK